MKKKFLIVLFNLILLLGILGTTVYAWYINADKNGPLSISSARMESKIQLYKGIDSDFDGYLDYDFDENKEKYELVTDATEETHHLIFQFDDVAPTQIYTWKIVITNNGDVDGYLLANLNQSILTNNNIKIMSMKVFDATKTSSNEKVFLGNPALETNGTFHNIVFGGASEYSEDANLKRYFVSHMPNHNTTELIIQIKIEAYPVISAYIDSEATYQNLQGKTSSFEFLDVSLLSTKSTEL